MSMSLGAARRASSRRRSFFVGRPAPRSRMMAAGASMGEGRGAPIARAAYTDVSAPRPAPMDAPAATIRDRGAGRPTKQERRRHAALRAAPSDIELERIRHGDRR